MNSSNHTPNDPQETYEEYGYRKAREHKGNLFGLKNCLDRLVNDVQSSLNDDSAEQNKLKQPFKDKLDLCNSDLKKEEDALKNLNEKVEEKEKEIQKIEEEKETIRTDPEVAGLIEDNTKTFQLVIGGIILLGVSCYLFIFYSSTAYSAFFKEFELSEESLSNALFDPMALYLAWNSSITAFSMVLLVPFIFLGLAYMLHAFIEKRMYGWLAGMGSLAFLFDLLLAYHISEKIYNLNAMVNLGDATIPPYSLRLASESSDFWMIIFSGYVVYLSWGLVYWLWLTKLDPHNEQRKLMASKTRKVSNIEKEIRGAKELGEAAKSKISKFRAEIEVLKKKIDVDVIVPSLKLEHVVTQFFDGWLSYMAQNNMPDTEIARCHQEVTNFLAGLNNPKT